MKNTLKFFSILLNPSKKKSSDLYELFSTQNKLAEKSLYLNLGYWKNAQTYDEACEAMAELLADTAKIGPEDSILDVGFGFGDQDFFWMEKYKPKKITGLNITKSQVELARQRAQALKCPEKFDFQYGSATQMPFPAETFDKVLALETAFHFDTREKFFQQAYSVLRSQGRIALADIIHRFDAKDLNIKNHIIDFVGRSFWQIPRANKYSEQVYRSKMEAIGFKDIQIRSIREEVYPLFSQYNKKKLQDPEMVRNFPPLLHEFMKASKDGKIFDIYDYAIVTALKP